MTKRKNRCIHSLRNTSSLYEPATENAGVTEPRNNGQAKQANDDNLEITVSRSGTSHLTGHGAHAESRRVRSLCGYTIDLDETPPEAMKDCVFCLEVLHLKREKAEAERLRKLIALAARKP